MPISRRLRFEILRRDNFTCHYCGAKPKDSELTVDHVTPVALGGTDEPANLAAACRDCNAGKTSSAPDQQTVEKVKDAAKKWSAAMAQAAKEAQEETSGRQATYDAVLRAWPTYYRNRIPADYARTIDQFMNAGLPSETIVQLAKVASARPGIGNRWSYFCGACWNKVREFQARALELLDDDSQ